MIISHPSSSPSTCPSSPSGEPITAASAPAVEGAKSDGKGHTSFSPVRLDGPAHGHRHTALQRTRSAETSWRAFRGRGALSWPLNVLMSYLCSFFYLHSLLCAVLIQLCLQSWKWCNMGGSGYETSPNHGQGDFAVNICLLRPCNDGSMAGFVLVVKMTFAVETWTMAKVEADSCAYY